MKITEVRATTCRIPLSSPIVMGELKFDAREYLVVEVMTDEGVTGLGFGMTRDAPLAPIVIRNVAPRLIGADPLATEAIWERLYNGNLTIGQRGLFMRCLSAADIALWDIKAQVAGLPLWQLARRVSRADRRRAWRAAIRARAGRSTRSARRSRGYAAQGYPWIKIAAGPLEDDTERLRVSAAAVGDSLLAYDAHWAWRTLPAVVPTVRRWTEFDLAFIEDPFPSESPRLAAGLREQTGIALALGEDVTGRHAYRDLIAAGAAGHPAPRRDDDRRDQRGDQDLRHGRGPLDPRPAPHLPRAPRPSRGRPADRDGRRGDRPGAGDRPPVEHPGGPAPAGRRARHRADRSGHRRRARPGGARPLRDGRGDAARLSRARDATVATYDELRRDARWDIPARYNIAADTVDRHAAQPPGGLALIVEDEAGAVTRMDVRRGPRCLDAAGQRARRPRARPGRAGRDPPAADARDRDRPPRRLPVGADRRPAVRAVRPGRARVPAGRFGRRRAGDRRRELAEGRRDPRPAARTCGRSWSWAAEGVDGTLDYGAISAAARRRTARPRTAADDPAIIIYTSGTTGPPKGALHAHRFLLGHLPGVAAAARLRAAAGRSVLDARGLGLDRRPVRRPVPGLALGPAGASRIGRAGSSPSGRSS